MGTTLCHHVFGFLFLQKKQKIMQARMKNVNSVWDWAGIVLVASKDEARDMSERVSGRMRRARSTLVDNYWASKEKVSRIWSKLKDDSDENKDTTMPAHARRKREKS